MSQFKASPYEQSVNSKSTIVPSDHQQKYRDGETMRFEVPAFMSYIDPRQSYLKCKLSIEDNATTNHIRLKLDPGVGAQGIIDRIRIYDGNNQVQLENLENYAERVNLTNHYSKNQSIKAKRELLEGMEFTTTFTEGQLFNAYDPTTVVNTGVNMNPNSLEIAMPLHSGVLGGRKLFPVELFDGLRVEIDLNNAGKFLKNFNGDGLATDVGGKPFANGVAINTGGAGSANIDVFGLNAGGTTNTRAEDIVAGSNIKVGDTISGIVADGSVEVLGIVQSLSQQPQGGAFATDHLRITLTAPYNPANANKNLPVWAQGTAPLGDVFVSTSQYNNNVPRVVIEDVELVVKQVSPPAGMLQQYAKQVATPEGVRFDIMTYDTYRNNIQSAESVSQVQIPSYNSRAKGILCCPMNNGLAQNLTNDNLDTTLDTIKEYQFYINGQPQPTRAVPTSTLSAVPATCSQVAMWELEKTLKTCGVEVRDLNSPERHFAVGRALARYGGVYNLKDVGGLALKQEYSNAQENKLLISFVGHLRKLVVNSSGKIVEL
jgi:hypothetical protein